MLYLKTVTAYNNFFLQRFLIIICCNDIRCIYYNVYYVYTFRLVVQKEFIQEHNKYCLSYFINVNGTEFRHCYLDALSAI